MMRQMNSKMAFLVLATFSGVSAERHDIGRANVWKDRLIQTSGYKDRYFQYDDRTQTLDYYEAKEHCKKDWKEYGQYYPGDKIETIPFKLLSNEDFLKTHTEIQHKIEQLRSEWRAIKKTKKIQASGTFERRLMNVFREYIFHQVVITTHGELRGSVLLKNGGAQIILQPIEDVVMVYDKIDKEIRFETHINNKKKVLEECTILKDTICNLETVQRADDYRYYEVSLRYEPMFPSKQSQYSLLKLGKLIKREMDKLRECLEKVPSPDFQDIKKEKKISKDRRRTEKTFKRAQKHEHKKEGGEWVMSPKQQEEAREARRNSNSRSRSTSRNVSRSSSPSTDKSSTSGMSELLVPV